jgi:iron(III) transport system substrate-binding protein
VVYSPHGKEMLVAFARAYEAVHPEEEVQWLDMGSQDAYDRIRTERSNPQADVWWGAPAITFLRAEQEGLLTRYIPSWDSAVTADLKSQNGQWFGTFLTPEVILYNNRALREQDAPADWDDLLDPRWRGKIALRSPLASGTMRMIFSALIQTEERRTGSVDSGFAYLRRLDGNTSTYAADPTQLYLMIAREEALVTLWDLPDVMIQIEKNSYPFSFKFPRSGTPLIVDAIAIVRGAPHPERAKTFYEFVTSKEALIRQAREFGRIPVRHDIPPAELPPWIASLHFTPLPVDWESVVKHEQDWMKRWDDEVKGRGSSTAAGG